MNTHFIAYNTAAQRQQGIALIMAIILLIIATLTGLVGMRNTSLQEKLAANLYDRAIAMQAAEFALGAAEKYIHETARATVTAANADCSKPDSSCPALPENTFTTAGGSVWTNVALPTSFKKGADSGTPQYFIQYLGLKNSDANTDTSQSGNLLQYGMTGGGSNKTGTTQNATYRVTARSGAPTADNDRAIVVLTSLVKSN